MKIQDEIKQSKFSSPHQKAVINLLYTASWMNHINSNALKPFNISIQQFNVLRILRGLGSKPASIKLLTERMLDKMSNASRLVDKLVKKELVERKVCPGDRRQVDIMITSLGLKTIEEASNAVDKSMLENLNGINDAEASHLSDLLDKMRS